MIPKYDLFGINRQRRSGTARRNTLSGVDIDIVMAFAHVAGDKYRRGRGRSTVLARILAPFAPLAFVWFVCNIFELPGKPIGSTSMLVAPEIPSVRLAVLYSYFEGESTPECEIVMKRVNLFFFLKCAVYESPDVDFIFTFSGNIPSAVEMYSSVGLPIPPNRELLPSYKNVISRLSHTKAADLCHHAQTSVAIGVERYRHVVFINDGVRGPFGTRKPGAIQNQRFRGIPSWLETYFKLLYGDPSVGAVGTVLSREITTHLQGWFVLLKRRDFQNFVLPAFNQTCFVERWSDAIELELEISTSMLSAHKKLAALFPQKGYFSKQAPSKKMNMNPITKFALKHPGTAIQLQKVAFLKIGGNFARQDIHNNATKNLMNALTREIIGEDRTNYWCFS